MVTKKYKRFAVLTASSLAIAVTSSMAAQTTASESTAGASAKTESQAEVAQLNKRDREIMRDIALVNLAEIRTSQMALERAQDPEIREFAQRMIDDHSTLQERLAYLAKVKNVQLPTELDREHQRTAERLSKMEGEKFDAEYRKKVAEQAHQETHKVLRQSVAEAEDPQLMALITQALPLIEQHLVMAKNMDESTGQTSGGQASGGQPGAVQSGGSEAGPGPRYEGATMTEGLSGGNPAATAGTGGPDLDQPLTPEPPPLPSESGKSGKAK